MRLNFYFMKVTVAMILMDVFRKLKGSRYSELVPVLLQSNVDQSNWSSAVCAAQLFTAESEVLNCARRSTGLRSFKLGSSRPLGMLS